jgi:hypothetical protein
MIAMPKFLGITFVWRLASSLQPGDELLFDNGQRVFVTTCDPTSRGTFLELSNRELGYVNSRNRYRVIS